MLAVELILSIVNITTIKNFCRLFAEFLQSFQTVSYCEVYMRYFIFELWLQMQVKNDRSKFSNLSNWKEEA